MVVWNEYIAIYYFPPIATIWNENHLHTNRSTLSSKKSCTFQFLTFFSSFVFANLPYNADKLAIFLLNVFFRPRYRVFLKKTLNFYQKVSNQERAGKLLKNAYKRAFFLNNALSDQNLGFVAVLLQNAFFHLKRILNKVGGRKISGWYPGVFYFYIPAIFQYGKKIIPRRVYFCRNLANCSILSISIL